MAPALPIGLGVWTRFDLRPLPLIAGMLLLVTGCGDEGPTQPRIPPLTITTASVESGSVGQLYSEGVSAEGGGGEFFWELVGGALPPGLAIAVEDLPQNDLLITGIPTSAGSFSFALQVTSPGADPVTAQFTLQIAPPPNDLRISNVALPPIAAGIPAAIPLRTTGQNEAVSTTWTLVAGALPPGLQLQPSGVITGAAAAVGDFVFSVGVSAGNEQTFRRLSLRVVQNETQGFQLTTFPVLNIPADIRPHLNDAIALWERVIVGDLTPDALPADFFGEGGCGGYGDLANGAAIDDVLVLVNIDSIDGPGDVLAQAGPCAVRDDLIPVLGVLTLDSSDLTPLVGTSTLTAIIAHEIGHVLGFGTLWEALGLLEGSGTADPRFTGARAVAAWQQLGGSGAVPVENEGGEGTREGHIRESVFNREMMTGFSEPVGVPQPLSIVSVGSMADLGFTVDLAAADPFALPTGVAGVRSLQETRSQWELVGFGPVRTLGGAVLPAAAGETP